MTAKRRYREALVLIADRGGDNRCSTSTAAWSVCRSPRSGRTRDAEYGADQWCDECVATAALEGLA